MSEKEKRRPDGVQGGGAKRNGKGLSGASMRHSPARFKSEGGGHEQRP